MEKYYVMPCPRDALDLVWQKYDAGWSCENVLKITTWNTTSFVCMAADNPEAFMYFLRLREESQRITEIALSVIDDGMQRPIAFDYWGMLWEWTRDGEDISRRTIDLSGYLAD